MRRPVGGRRHRAGPGCRPEQRLVQLGALEEQVAVVLPGEADAAVQLHRVLGDLGIDVAGRGLGGGGVEQGLWIARSPQAHGLGYQGAGGHQRDLVIGAAVLQRLERADRLAELLAHLQVLDGAVEDDVGAADRVAGQGQPRLGMQGFADRIGGRHGVAGASRQAGEVAGGVLGALDGHLRRIGLADQEMVAVVDDEQARAAALQHVIVSLGSERRRKLTGRDPRQPGGLLIVAARQFDGAPGQPGSEQGQGRQGATDLLEQDGGFGHAQAQPVVSFRNRQRGPAQTGGLGPQGFVEDGGGVDVAMQAFAVDLAVQHVAHAVAQRRQVHRRVARQPIFH
jgi:hypothetical protein